MRCDGFAQASFRNVPSVSIKRIAYAIQLNAVEFSVVLQLTEKCIGSDMSESCGVISGQITSSLGCWTDLKLSSCFVFGVRSESFEFRSRDALFIHIEGKRSTHNAEW
jgi:hypothetical protein